MIFSSTGRIPRRMLCYGASGTGSQFALDMRHQAGADVEFLGYIDDVNDPRRKVEPEFRVHSFAEILNLEDIGVFVPVHDPATRRHLHARLTDHGIPVLGTRGAPHLAHPQAVIGEGSLALSTTRLGFSTRLGRGVVALSDGIAHDVEIGDFTTLAVGSLVLGHVSIGSDVFIGARAIIKNGTLDRPIVIGDGARVGAGAVVTRDVAAGDTVAGPPAMRLARWRALLGNRHERT